jgi:hypothetical protein
MGSRPAAVTLAVFVALAAACDEPKGTWATPTGAASSRKAAPGGASARAAPTASATKAEHVELQRFRLTSGVESREPVDELGAAGAGQRVYAHAALRNRTGAARRVSLVFLVDNEERTTVDLEVEPSWSWRTWGYVTLRAGDEKATLKVELRDDQGELLAERSVPIEAKPSTKLR